MKVGFHLLLAILMLNLVTGLVYTLNVPGTEHSQVLVGSGSASSYEQRFNATEFMERQQPNIIASLPYLGHIYGAAMIFWNALRFIIDGFPMMLEQYKGYIPDVAGRTAFSAIILIIRAVFMFIIFTFMFQVFTGREVQD